MRAALTGKSKFRGMDVLMDVRQAEVFGVGDGLSETYIKGHLGTGYPYIHRCTDSEKP